MPKKYKTYPKTKPNKIQPKTQQKPSSILRHKFYWIMLTFVTIVFIFASGYLMDISLAKEAMILGTILSLIIFAFYLGFKPSPNYDKRATFIFVGASILGFSIWAATMLSLNTAGVILQMASSIGVNLFVATSLMICLVFGAFIGDVIGKRRESISFFINNKLRK